MLELQHISFERDNKKILDDVNIRFEDNKFVAITGPNGSGKSMLAKIIMGIVKPDAGKSIRFLQKGMVGIWRMRSFMGMMIEIFFHPGAM